jgi:hypothetical protein
MIPRGQATVNGRWRSQVASVHSDLVTQIRGGIAAKLSSSDPEAGLAVRPHLEGR